MILGLACICGDTMAQTSREELSDLVGRIEYSFYAGDSSTLKQAIESLEKAEVSDAQKATQVNYLNFGRWKMAQLLAERKKSGDAGDYADKCTDSVEVKKFSKKAKAEYEALQAACYAVLAEVRFVRALLYRSSMESHLEKAVKLDPKNLQVTFVSAWAKAYREPAAPETYTALKQSVSAFADNAGRLQDTGWGYAEALYMLGRTELARHDMLAARNSLERASVIAPDYVAVQALLKQLTVR
jgi:tetratricopeptide (TPR) repeat protein